MCLFLSPSTICLPTAVFPGTFWSKSLPFFEGSLDTAPCTLFQPHRLHSLSLSRCLSDFYYLHFLNLNSRCQNQTPLGRQFHAHDGGSSERSIAKRVRFPVKTAQFGGK